MAASSKGSDLMSGVDHYNRIEDDTSPAWQVGFLEDNRALSAVFEGGLPLICDFPPSRLELFDTIAAIRERFSKMPRLGVVFLDGELHGASTPWKEFIDLIGRSAGERGAVVVAMPGRPMRYERQVLLQEQAPSNVWFVYSPKPLNLRDVGDAWSEWAAFVEQVNGPPPEALLEDGVVGGDIDPSESSKPTPFDVTLAAYDSWQDLLQALPYKPMDELPTIDDVTRDRFIKLLIGGLELLEMQSEQAQVYDLIKTWTETLPSGPNLAVHRQILLHYLSDLPDAALVLDCFWHDSKTPVSVYMNAFELSTDFTQGTAPSRVRDLQAKALTQFKDMLDPVLTSFRAFLREGKNDAFWEVTALDFARLQANYSIRGLHDGFPPLSVMAPRGALPSIWRTFANNLRSLWAQERRSDGRLEYHWTLEDDELVVRIADNARLFSPKDFETLFDDTLQSGTGGWGTGLSRLADLMRLMNQQSGRPGVSGPAIRCFQATDWGWKVKAPKSVPQLLGSDIDLAAIHPDCPAWATKFFELRFKVMTPTPASTEPTDLVSGVLRGSQALARGFPAWLRSKSG